MRRNLFGLTEWNRAAKIKSIIMATMVSAFLISTVVAVSGCAMFPLTINRPVVNQTGVTIVRVFIRNAGTKDWGTHLNRQVKTRINADGSRYPVTDYNGNYVYEDYDLNHGGGCPYSFSTPRVPDGQTPQYKTVDVLLVTKNGILYGKNNLDLASVEKIVITQEDLYPVLIMQNNTGFPINVTSPSAAEVGEGDNAIYQMPDLGNDRKHLVSYSIGNYGFEYEAVLEQPQTTLALTDRPPTVTVKNNTGYPVTLTSPFSEVVLNGGNSRQYPKNRRNDNPVITYFSGTFQYTRESVIGNEDIVITLTEKDRPPIVTVENNTGNTVNIVFLRNTGSNWPEQNMLTLKLKEDGTLDDTQATTQAGERRGSFTNKETFKFWMGNLAGLKPGTYDIRLDDVQGNPYVKSNIQITEDVTLTFTPQDKP